uniref:Uncharacterized protein n=2 Tax=Rhodnius prolixus TaxID=13249 RepID=T1HXR7_RHOPR
MDILKDDNLIDTLNAAQMYSMELWIENIDDSGKSRHVNVHEETGSKLGDSDSKTTVEGKLGNSTSKSMESMPTLASSKPNKNSSGDGEGKKPDPKQKKKESKKEKEETEKKSIYTLEESTGDYILPSGLKPFRVRFTLFNRNVTLTQLDYEKITQIRKMLEGNTTTSTSSLSTKNASMGSEQEDIKKPESSKENVEETASSVSKVTSREKRQSIERGSASEKSKSNNSRQASSRQYHTEQPSDQLSAATTVKGTSRNGSPGASETTTKLSTVQFTKLLEVIGKTQDYDYKVRVGELDDLLEEDAFVPQSENVMNKGGCVTVAMAPMLAIQTLQSGSIQITVDRFGGRKEDEGDPIGTACVKIPSDWQETVLHAATNPRIAPVTLKVNNKVSIEERQENKTVGTLDYTLILTCYSGCVTSEGMPTFLGLWVSLAESKQTPCHKPMVRDNITLHPLKRKALNEDYEKIFKGHPIKMRKIC